MPFHLWAFFFLFENNSDLFSELTYLWLNGTLWRQPAVTDCIISCHISKSDANFPQISESKLNEKSNVNVPGAFEAEAASGLSILPSSVQGCNSIFSVAKAQFFLGCLTLISFCLGWLDGWSAATFDREVHVEVTSSRMLGHKVCRAERCIVTR